MPDRIYNVLFLCTGNSARSIMAEAIMNQLAAGRFKAYSAGSHPAGRVHPLALTLLQQHGHDVSGLRSKGWEEFAAPGAPHMDFVFTVCDRAAGETCPVWPGHPITAHWGYADPVAVDGDDAAGLAAFARVYLEISNRLRLFMSLPIEKLDRMTLQARVRALGREP